MVNATAWSLYPRERDPVRIVRIGGRVGAHGDFLYSLALFCTSSVVLSLSWLSCILPFIFTYNTHIHAPGRIRSHNHSRRAATDLRPRPCGRRNRVFKKGGILDQVTDYQLISSGLAGIHIYRGKHRIRSPDHPVRSRDLYLTTHNTHKRQTSVPPTVFEPVIPASDMPQFLALDRSAM